MILDNNIKFEEIESIAYNLEGKILKDVVLFDEFKGKNIGDNKKSFAVSFAFNDSKKTLTDKIIDKIMTRFSDAYKLELGAIIRDK
jgi:phenylalanyl-tRNA synthetase beta chain